MAIGIDSHKNSLAVCAIDELGRAIATGQFGNEPRGHRALAAWIAQHGADRVVGIEGSRLYGTVASERLVAAGETVYEVPAFLTHRERAKRPARGKSDPADALAIARVVARGEGLAPAARRSINDDLKLLVDRRQQLVEAKTKTANRIHRHLVVLAPGYETTVPRITRRVHGTRIKRLLRGRGGVRLDIVHDLIDEFCALEVKIATITKELAGLVAASGTTLTAIQGVGFVTAAKILGEVGDIRRIRSKAAFAMINGTAPIEASSGKTKRHRLNRGGNRQLNHALHMVALARCRADGATKAYRARRIAQGASNKEAMRSLKRHLSNVVYRQLRADIAAQEAA